MSHPFGDLVSQHLHRRHGLSQSKLAAGILQAPTIITAMCKGRRLTGPQARERVLAIIRWLHEQDVLYTRQEANALLHAAGMSALNPDREDESRLAQKLSAVPNIGVAPTDTYSIKHNLPAPTTSLIGREKDTQAIQQLLNRKDVRLVTLIGPPGVGKTRLALQVGWEMLNVFSGGVWFVPLAAIDDSKFVAETIMQALELQSAGRSPQVALRNHLRERRLLLVLDNFEQLLGDDDTSSAANLIAELLASAPKLKIIVTSRATLHVQGEYLHEVPQLAEQSAVELFIARAQAIVTLFTVEDEDTKVIAEICQRLDYLPLAIELAAARVRQFEPAQLLARLSERLSLLTDGARDLPPRQRTLRNTIAWSYNLLSLEEQTLFRRLGVFAGGCTLEAAEKVAGEGLHTPVRDLLPSIIDKSLVKVEISGQASRYHLLELVREYANEQLMLNVEFEKPVLRHLEFYTALAESTEPRLNGIERSDWVVQLTQEQNNFRAALARALSSGNVESGLRLSAALGTYWLWTGNHDEGWNWISKFTSSADSRRDVIWQAGALRAGVNLLRQAGDIVLADRIAGEALALYRSTGNELAAAQLLADLGCNAWSRADFTIARTLCVESVAIARKLGSMHDLAYGLAWHAAVERDNGHIVEARALFEESIAIGKANHAILPMLVSMQGLSVLEFITGNIAQAALRLRETMQLGKQHAPRSLPYGLLCSARFALAMGNVTVAHEELSSAVAVFRQDENGDGLGWALCQFGFVNHVLGKAGLADSLMREGLRIQHHSQRKLLMIESLELFASMFADRLQHARAGTLFAATATLRARTEAPFPQGDLPIHEPRMRAVKAALDGRMLEQCQSAGEQMTLDEAVAFALEQ